MEGGMQAGGMQGGWHAGKTGSAWGGRKEWAVRTYRVKAAHRWGMGATRARQHG